MKTIVKPKRHQVYHITCKDFGCNAVIEVSKEELRLKEDPIESFYILICPHCRTETWIRSHMLKTYLFKE